MPELPEVEHVRTGLEKHIVGTRLERVKVLHPRPVRAHLAGPEDFEQTLVGRSFGVPARRGKYLWLPLSDGDAVLTHLGMSGQFRFNDAADEHLPNTRVLFDLSSGTQLRFVDQRMFGGLSISQDGAFLPQEVAHIALDPFDAAFDQTATAAKIRTKKSAIKRVLLDQTVVSGFGNIYVDEALWRAKLHYDRPANTLAQKTVVGLLNHGADVMREALSEGGTSFDALYVNVNGESGYFARGLSAYGRENLPCFRCGRAMVREPFMNRSSFFCPKCQPRPRKTS